MCVCACVCVCVCAYVCVCVCMYVYFKHTPALQRHGNKKQKTVHERDEYSSSSTHTLSRHTRTHLSPLR